MEKLICKICGFEGTCLTMHVKKHNITPKKYKELYNVEKMQIFTDEHNQMMSKKIKEMFNTPEFKNKMRQCTVSHFTAKYWLNKGFTEEEAKKKISEIQKKNNNKKTEECLKNSSIFNYNFYILHGMSEKDAKEKVRNLQSMLSARSSKFLGKKRTEDQKKKISNSMKNRIKNIGVKKWTEHFGKSNIYSNSEVELFNYVKTNFDKKAQSGIEIGGKFPDIVCEDYKIIIEYYGNLWHANPIYFKANDIHKIIKKKVSDIWKYDEERIKLFEENGYRTEIVWEEDWNKNKLSVVSKLEEIFNGKNTH